MILDKKSKHGMSTANIIIIVLMIIGLMLTYIVYHIEINEYILKTKYKIELPLWLLIILSIIVPFVILALKFLLKIYKNSKKTIVIKAEPPKDYEHLPIIEETKHNDSPQSISQNLGKEASDAIAESKKVFFDLLIKLKTVKINYPDYISTIVTDNFQITDKAFEVLFYYLQGDKKTEIEKSYNEYKYPYANRKDVSLDDLDLIVYDFGEVEMIKGFGDNPPFKTGKGILLHNLQTIINLIE